MTPTVAILAGRDLARGSAAFERVDALRAAFESEGWNVATSPPRVAAPGRSTSALREIVSALTSRWIATTLTRIGLVGELGLRERREARRFLRATACDLVVVSVPPLATASIRTDRPLILDYRDVYGAADHPPLASRILRALEGCAARRADAVSFAGAAAVGRRLADRLGVAPERLIHVRNGIRREDLPPHPAGTAREQAPAHAAAIDLVFVGNLYGGADLRPLFAAMSAARSDVRLDVVSAGTARSLRRYLSGAPRGKVRLSAALARPELYRRLAHADAGIIVLNRDYPVAESVPAKTFDYLGVGLPILYIGPQDAALLAESESGIHSFRPDDPGIVEFIESLPGRRSLPRRPVVVDRVQEARRMVEIAERLVGPSRPG
jgi:hypothetical protein